MFMFNASAISYVAIDRLNDTISLYSMHESKAQLVTD